MATAAIEVNSVLGSDDDVPIDTLVQLSNDDDGDESTYLWSILDQPPGAADSLSSTTIENPTFTPEKEGSYLIQLIIDEGLSTESTDRVVVAVRQLKTLRRCPAAGEQSEVSSAKGWALSVNELLRDLDGKLADPGLRVAVVGGSTDIASGKVVRYTSSTTLKSGLPGEEEIVVVEAVTATSNLVLTCPLAIMISGIDGDTTPSPGDLAYVRWFGLLPEIVSGGSPSVSDAVYVDNSGDISLAPGSYVRVLGNIIKVSTLHDVFFGAGMSRQPGLAGDEVVGGNLTLFDHFAFLDEHRWTKTEVNNGSVDIDGGEGVVGTTDGIGILLLQAPTSGDEATVSEYRFMNGAHNPIAKALVKTPTNLSINVLRFGLRDTGSENNTAIIKTVSSSVGWTVECESSDGGSSDSSADVGDNVVGATWYELMVEIVSGSEVNFYVDGELIETLNGSGAVPNGEDELGCFVSCTSSSSGGTAVAVDWHLLLAESL